MKIFNFHSTQADAESDHRGSHPRNWKYRSGPLAWLLLPVVMILPLFAKLWLLIVIGFGIALYVYGIPFGSLIIPTILVGLYYRYVIAPGVMSCWAMLSLSVGPLPWPQASERKSHLHPLRRPNWTALIAAHPVPICLGTTLLATWLAASVFNLRGDTFAKKLSFVAVVVGLTATSRFGILLFHGIASSRTKILFFWRFSERNAKALKGNLLPVLSAFGKVTAIDDTNRRILAETRVELPEDVPGGSIERVELSEDQWQEGARTLISESDIIVVDVTDLSHWVAWEIVQSLSCQERPLVILVGRVDYLFFNHEFVDQLRRTMGAHVSAERTVELLGLLRSPISYSEDFANIVFAWRMFKRMRKAATCKTI